MRRNTPFQRETQGNGRNRERFQKEKKQTPGRECQAGTVRAEGGTALSEKMTLHNPSWESTPILSRLCSREVSPLMVPSTQEVPREPRAQDHWDPGQPPGSHGASASLLHGAGFPKIPSVPCSLQLPFSSSSLMTGMLRRKDFSSLRVLRSWPENDFK